MIEQFVAKIKTLVATLKGINRRRNSTIDINQKKEVNYMIEELKKYVAKYEADKNEMANKGIDMAKIDAETRAYREDLVRQAEAEKTANIEKITHDIECLKVIIAEEEDKLKPAEEVNQ